MVAGTPTGAKPDKDALDVSSGRSCEATIPELTSST